MLLSNQAKINSNPQLEIYADDVKCSHGSTTGKIDENALFYLQSRGINRTDAIELMMQSFANDIFSKINYNLVRNEMENILKIQMKKMLK